MKHFLRVESHCNPKNKLEKHILSVLAGSYNNLLLLDDDALYQLKEGINDFIRLANAQHPRCTPERQLTYYKGLDPKTHEFASTNFFKISIHTVQKELGSEQ